jgi:hypothetical protein
MADALQLTAALEKRGPAGAFILTDEQVQLLGGGRKAFGVRVVVNDRSLELRLARMGGENLIGVARAVREQAGLEIGAVYAVEIAADDGPRPVDVPEDLAAALAAEPSVDAAFAALAASHRKEFVRWVGEAKREATRTDRIAKTVEMVREGRHR